MRTYSANQAKTHFGEFLDDAQRAPVRVMRRDRLVGVMVSAQDYEAMRAFYADRLRHTMDRVADQAAAAGGRSRPHPVIALAGAGTGRTGRA